MLSNKQVVEQLIKKTPPLYHENFPVVLFWTPKSGCTSLMKWFFYHIGHLEKALEYSPWVHKYRLEVFQANRNHPSFATNILHSKKEYIKLIRNPYKRAVSSFYAVIKNPHFLGMNRKHLAESGLSFIQFLNLVKEVFTEDVQPDLHLYKQSVSGEKTAINRYIRLESFQASINNIERRYRLTKSPLSLFKESPHHHNHHMKIMGQHQNTIIQLKDLNNVKPLPSYESLYDKQAVKLVEEIYADDISLYRYTFTK
ncbi:sulfotransferase family protein [Fictibacillus nanhaiensis]|nr:sulfotransferase family 2 domain-containing protein [Fictibacillus nanhaiensis]MBY6037691.1 sulfotransferase family protein [Fictibacillus nanhaiensis]